EEDRAGLGLGALELAVELSGAGRGVGAGGAGREVGREVGAGPGGEGGGALGADVVQDVADGVAAALGGGRLVDRLGGAGGPVVLLAEGLAGDDRAGAGVQGVSGLVE